jgi:hypothetical protein
MKAKVCKHCAAGNQPQNGEHWIVKSVVSARISVVMCAATPKIAQTAPDEVV